VTGSQLDDPGATDSGSTRSGAPDDLLATEVFSAIQGEAALVGHRQVFVRLTGCNIRCAYCDQPEALERRPGPCRIEQTPGRRDWRVVESPLPIASLTAAVDHLCRLLPHHSVSLTGGEPLLQSRRVVELAAQLAAGGRAVMLETNGSLVPALERIAPWLTYVSMDVKLPSVDREQVSPETQRRFLGTALAAGLTTWVKIVIGATTDPDEFDSAIAMVAESTGPWADRADRADPWADRVDRWPEVFLQPVTPFGTVTATPTPAQVLELQERALRVYPRVRVVPQTHKGIGQL
jgi:7-carboxy-7-deazaguanine synthase